MGRGAGFGEVTRIRGVSLPRRLARLATAVGPAPEARPCRVPDDRTHGHLSGTVGSPAAASYYFDWVTSVDTDPASTYGVTTVTAGTEVTVVAEAVINPNEFHYLVILDSHNSVVEYCAATTCSALVTSTDATSKTYHAVVGDWDGSNPVSPPSDANITVTVTWTAGPPATLWVGGLPNPYGVGTAGSLTVFADDAYGNVATGYRGTIHFTSSDPAAVLPANYTFTAADAGVHTFSGGLTFKTAGTQSVTATDTVVATLTGVQSGIVVTPSAATTLVVSGLPSHPVSGDAHSVVVTAKDAYGNTATGYRGTVHFTSTDPAAVLPANHTFTAGDAGTHTFSVTLNTVGTQAVRARDTVTATIGVIDVSSREHR